MESGAGKRGRLKKKSGILYLIADLNQGEEALCKALAAGVDLVQLREKEISSAEYLRRAKRVRELADSYDTLFLVNDRLDIALLSGADGVHLGPEDIPIRDARRLFPQGIIGATARTREQAGRAWQEGADYLGSGAWFPTGTKADAVPISPDTYREILDAAPIPNVAVGGITLENGHTPLAWGAQGLAVSAGILRTADAGEAVKGFRRMLEERKDSNPI
ncbi:MAG: thiamine phosphate synthase [Lachnospiraceae bacterium]|jgi:thiamine-phosphate pyrophosphorylase|nr:thiamine phosphate synthase [Lachnospiraceae bacterium]